MVSTIASLPCVHCSIWLGFSPFDKFNQKNQPNTIICLRLSLAPHYARYLMAEGRQAPDAQLFNLLSNLLQEVESISNQEEVELRAKIEALGMEVSKVPSISAQNLNEIEIAQELDKLSSKLDDVDKMISSAMVSDPQVQSLLSSTADVWMPVITATSEERRNFMATVGQDSHQVTEQEDLK